jgi:hypothetical protein
MKKILYILAFLAINSTVFAQAPQKMSYQAVVRTASNTLVSNSPVGVQISILSGSAGGPSVYTERQTINTNANGLLSMEVGVGTVISGSFTGINWGSGSFFIKSEFDPNGGTNYTITGTSQLVSVPYALTSADNRWSSNGSDISNSNSGNVGIGVGSPSQKLEVAGAILARANSGNLALRLDRNSGTPGYEFFSDPLGLNICESGVGCDRMFFANGGAIGINTATPTKRLHLKHDQFTGVGNLGGFEIENAFNNARWTLYSSQSSSFLRLFFNDLTRGEFDSNSGNYTATSDGRLKKNVEPLTKSLEKIMALKPSRYEYISAGQNGKKYLGFIAQELKEVLPEVVTVHKSNDGAQDLENLHMVSYSEIIPVLTAGIQEQQAIINAQAEQIKLLEKRLTDLEKRQ